jgi:hypothetical protein
MLILLHLTGPIVRISPTMLLVASASDLPTIYHRNANKSPFYISLQLSSATSVFHSLSHTENVYLRKLVAQSYSFSQTKKYEPDIDAIIMSWLQLSRERYSKKGAQQDVSVDFAQLRRFSSAAVRPSVRQHIRCLATTTRCSPGRKA